MYNEDLKLKFANTIDSLYTRELCLSTFKRVYKFENKCNKDIFEMAENEISEVLNHLVLVRGGTTNKSPQINILENYVKWCIENNINNSNDNIFKVSIDSSDRIKEVMVKNPEQLDSILNAVFKPVNKNTIDNVYRCATWLLYCGIKKADLSNIKAEHIDVKNCRINYESEVYELYPQSIDSIESCINLKEFTIIHPSYLGIDNRYDGESILRTTTGDIKPDTLQQLINRKINAAAKNGISVIHLKIDKIRLSGIFYKAYVYESKGVPIDFYSIVSREMKGKTYSVSKKNSMKTITLDRAREYMAEYVRWKNVFYN